ncbi:hypothetical protein B0I27_109105 [Arcticibacter pallidicorallinus]|uniref:Uncharacterized protein n=1 Tax=Arcticibacter pallidicorallinus TaxID=1259464 RepID=A0A2T0TXI2_9SPHI|nr:hypothetical protein [Arcticibacter pallidicorallinus]PRY50382.1 hypothetical protein B0I27_109105 [Arcticibacter pallidicorallinus]
MIIRVDETRKQTITGKTINGFYLSVLLLHSRANVLIPKTQYGTGLGFDASQVNLKATLKRDGKLYSFFNNNLGILGHYNSLLSGTKNWLLGTDYVRPTAENKHRNVRTLFVELGGHVNLRGTDEIEFEVTVGRNTFNATHLDQSVCYIDVNPSYSIGKEVGIFSTYSETIQAGTTSDRFNLGDNVTKIALVNFDDTDETQQIVQNMQISSDRFDQSYNLAELINRHNRNFGKAAFNYPFPPNQPGNILETYRPAYAQSFVVLNDEEIDQAIVDLTFDGSKVTSSKNYLVYTSFVTSLEIIQRSQALEEKHTVENLNKLPVSL